MCNYVVSKLSLVIGSVMPLPLVVAGEGVSHRFETS